MFADIFALFVIGLILISSEIMWKLDLLRGEAGRKYVHILSGIWVATWPFFLNFQTIVVLSLVLLVGVFLSRNLNIGKSIHAIKRLSNGDTLFPVGVGLAALLTDKPWIFCAAMLHIGLADGLAGLIGNHYNVGRYTVFGHTKSLLGTGIFALTSFMIVAGLFDYGLPGFTAQTLVAALIVIPLLTAAAENASPYGLDNITVPLITIGLLQVFI